MISTSTHLTILESVDSTNNYAMARLRTGLAKHGDAFFAMAQVNGKGQRGKAWLTERGANIIITLVIQPTGLQLQQQFQLSVSVALAVHDFFSRYAGDETFIKWPNDIYWRDRKAGGILIESIVGSSLVNSREPIAGSQNISIENSGFTEDALTAIDSGLRTTSWHWAIIGMGININQTIFPENILRAVSLKQITGKDWNVIELAKELCGCVQKRYEELIAGKNLLQQYNERLFKKDQLVKLKKGSRIFEATIKEVNSLGELVVITSIEEHFSFGEVEFVFESGFAAL